ncbi:MAG: NADH-quinone oxidoreductase subunit A [Candidatus Micrarchaeia archaeon]
MLYNYIAVLFFALFSIAIPAILLFMAKLIRKNVPPNEVKNAPYESGEITVGKSIDIYTEYTPYFMLFIPFELITVALILWAYVSRLTGYAEGMLMLMLIILEMVFALICYKFIGVKNE